MSRKLKETKQSPKYKITKIEKNSRPTIKKQIRPKSQKKKQKKFQTDFKFRTKKIPIQTSRLPQNSNLHQLPR
jgi:hypothetical protein